MCQSMMQVCQLLLLCHVVGAKDLCKYREQEMV